LPAIVAADRAFPAAVAGRYAKHTMRKVCTILLTMFVSVVLTGCSLLVSQGGKRVERVFAPTATVETIRKELGQPTARLAYPQPLLASAIPELVELSKYKSELALTTLIGAHEDYAYKGWVYEDMAEGIVMCDTLTFGAGELFLFPLSVYGAVEDSQQTHRYRVWYRTDDICFAHVELVPPKKNSQ
jgi:hypothetical protein